MPGNTGRNRIRTRACGRGSGGKVGGMGRGSQGTAPFSTSDHMSSTGQVSISRRIVTPYRYPYCGRGGSDAQLGPLFPPPPPRKRNAALPAPNSPLSVGSTSRACRSRPSVAEHRPRRPCPSGAGCARTADRLSSSASALLRQTRSLLLKGVKYAPLGRASAPCPSTRLRGATALSRAGT